MQTKNQVVDLQTYRSSGQEEPADVSPQHLPAGTTLLVGQYTVTDYLNCGGFGITYRARDSLNREVVIKECFPGEMAYRDGKAMGARSPKYRDELRAIVKHFVKEAQRQASVLHKNVVHVHQIFEENDTAYIAMDYIDGLDLLDLMEHDPTVLGPLQVEQLVREMLDAIRFVHDLGLLHRDISPDNILINRSGEPVLIDFGSAHENTATRHLSRLKFVKDGYSPQEFYISGSEQGPWSDIYSFAASMYHIITGEPPAESQRRLAALAAKQPDPYEPLAGRVDGYSPNFLEAIDHALETLPKNRFQSAQEWLDQLDAEPLPVVVTEPEELFEEEEYIDINVFAAIRDVLSEYELAVHPAIAAGVGALALIGAAGLYAMVSGGTVETRTMDSIAFAAQENRTPTPPSVVAAPIQQVTFDLGASPELTAPSLAFRAPLNPTNVQPIGRTQPFGLTSVEQVSAPANPDLSALPGAYDLSRAAALPSLQIDTNGFAAPVPSAHSGLDVTTPGGVVRGVAPQSLPGYWLDTPPDVVVVGKKKLPTILRLD